LGPEIPRVSEAGTLVGPVYDIDRRHSYGKDFSGPSMTGELVGPVYVDRRHRYGHDYAKKLEQKQLIGPVYNVDTKHQVIMLKKLFFVVAVGLQ
jgi:hypothetical protein